MGGRRLLRLEGTVCGQQWRSAKWRSPAESGGGRVASGNCPGDLLQKPAAAKLRGGRGTCPPYQSRMHLTYYLFGCKVINFEIGSFSCVRTPTLQQYTFICTFCLVLLKDHPLKYVLFICLNYKLCRQKSSTSRNLSWMKTGRQTCLGLLV